MHTVFLDRADSYEDVRGLKERLNSALTALGKSSFTGRRVLVKPNFLKPSPPEKAVITHPSFLTALCELLRDMGAGVTVGDSPGFGSLESVVARAGLGPFFSRSSIPLADFSVSRKRKTPRPIMFREFDLPACLFEVDDIVNVPKLKTHQMMVLTLAVKNLYGCIQGMKKVSLHLTAGHDHDVFAALLLDLYGAVAPGINILDGIVGMDGEGPAAGRVRGIGLIAASDDALALDTTVASMLEIDKKKIPILRVAERSGLSRSVSFAPEGMTPRDFSLPAFRLPQSHRADFSMPGPLRKFAKQFLLSFPHVTARCTACGICVRHCPAGAIIIDGRARINRAECIRCYCCQELCEHDAVQVKRSFFR